MTHSRPSHPIFSSLCETVELSLAFPSFAGSRVMVWNIDLLPLEGSIYMSNFVRVQTHSAYQSALIPPRWGVDCFSTRLLFTSSLYVVNKHYKSVGMSWTESVVEEATLFRPSRWPRGPNVIQTLRNCLIQSLDWFHRGQRKTQEERGISSCRSDHDTISVSAFNRWT